MYKSSYAHFHSEYSNEPKNKAIPGYTGYIPFVKPENLHARGFTPISKDSFSNKKLGKNILGLSTNGFNINRETFLDSSKFASSSKYGKTEIQRSHPAWNEEPWKSTTQETHQPPKLMNNPAFRPTEKENETMKKETRSSGFATNHAYLDGLGWNPDKVLMGDNKRTEYRDRLNVGNDFHRDVMIRKDRKLKKKELNYKYN